MIAGTQSQAPELVVAAGILEGAGALNDRLTLKAATERLRELLSPAALWTPDTLPPSRTDEPEMPLLGHVPIRWQGSFSAPGTQRCCRRRQAWADRFCVWKSRMRKRPAVLRGSARRGLI
jgi:hypothetical protein